MHYANIRTKDIISISIIITHADFSAAEGSSAFRLLYEKIENIKLLIRFLTRKHKIPY